MSNQFAGVYGEAFWRAHATAKLNNVEPFCLAQRHPAAHDRWSSR